MVPEEDPGLDFLFRFVRNLSDQPYSGLSLLSEVSVEDGVVTKGLPDGPIPPAFADIVGLRVPCIIPRDSITLLEDISSHSLATLYKYYCKQYRVRCNSLVVETLDKRVGVFTATSFNLNGNYLGPRGLLPFFEVLRVSKHCTAFSAIGVGMDSASTEWLVASVIDHPSLADINLRDNKITIGGAKCLEYLLRRSPHIVSLRLEPSHLPPPVVSTLADLLAKSTARAAALSRKPSAT